LATDICPSDIWPSDIWPTDIWPHIFGHTYLANRHLAAPMFGSQSYEPFISSSHLVDQSLSYHVHVDQMFFGQIAFDQKKQNLFNNYRTMTYRWDSDFVRPYAWVQPRNEATNVPPTAARPHNLTYSHGNGKDTKKNLLSCKTFEPLGFASRIQQLSSFNSDPLHSKTRCHFGAKTSRSTFLLEKQLHPILYWIRCP
jgi:hypothetical protein